MSFDRNKRGRGRDKRDGFGEDSFDGYRESPSFGGGAPSSYDRGGFGAPRGGGGGFGGGDRGAPRSGGFGGGDRGGGGGMPAQVIGEGKGIVKFFNGQKGFGFIQCDDRPDDVFVHISAVEQIGLTALAEGQPLSFTLVDRGGRVSATELVIDGEPMAVEERPRRDAPDRGGFGGDRGARGGDRGGFGDRGAPRGGGFGGDRGGAPQRELTGEADTGTVKFFNGSKGFGFIQRDSGKDDAFVHISAVERAGMNDLQEGDRIKFDIEINRQGKFAAVNLSRADD